MVQVVETIVAGSMSELRQQLARPSRADMRELRLDAVKDLDVRGALHHRRLPVIVTCRPRWEGGCFDGSEEERHRILTEAAGLGAEYVDVEWKADRQLLERCRQITRVLISSHDFTGVPDDLAGRWDAMRRAGASLTKVAVTAHSLRDCLTLRQAAGSDDEHIAIAMGPAGQISRAWPAWFGSRWTYGGAAAPGQIGVDDSIDVFRVRETRTTSAPYAIAGSPLAHSASPAMHNAAFAALGMDAVYVPLQTTTADDFFTMADAIGLKGASVTIPLKQTLFTSRVAGDELVVETGALNTLRRCGATWEGRNFDVAGFLAPLEARQIALRGLHTTVLGAGGAARGAIRALVSRGAHVRVAARRPEAAADLASALHIETAAWPPAADWDLLVNTTPVGMSPHVDEAPVPAQALESAAGRVVYDLVYNPADTQLLRLARGAGATPIGGLEMLVDQACRQFEWWTDRKAPREVMEAAARKFLQA